MWPQLYVKNLVLSYLSKGIARAQFCRKKIIGDAAKSTKIQIYWTMTEAPIATAYVQQDTSMQTPTLGLGPRDTTLSWLDVKARIN